MELVKWFEDNKTRIFLGSLFINIVFIGSLLFIFLHNFLDLFGTHDKIIHDEIKAKKVEVQEIHERNEKLFKEIETDKIGLSQDETILVVASSNFIDSDWLRVANEYNKRHPYHHFK